MESHLAGHDYLAAERYTIADIALYAYTHVAHEDEEDVGGLCSPHADAPSTR